MRRGCIAVDEIICDGCGKYIKHPDRYLAVNEKDGVEDEEGNLVRYCVKCALEKGYARYKEERGEKILTFFPE